MTEKKNGVIQTYYNDKEKIKLLCEYFNFNGKREGEIKKYYYNAKSYLIYYNKNGKLEGEYKEYYNGQLCIVYNYKNGRAQNV